MKYILNSVLIVLFLFSSKAQMLNHEQWNSLLQKFVTSDGNVNYTDFKNKQEELNTYISYLSAHTPNANWSKNETLAYWINAYNALTIDLILKHYPVKSIKDIKNPWKQKLWTLGGKTYSLDYIEHSILRKLNEPRIHFAIVCASYSCPKLLNTAYSPANLEEQLTKATKYFLEDTARNQISTSEIKLSKIFKWFASDFKQNGSLIDFLNLYSKITIDAHAKKSYLDYNWSLND